MTTTYLPHDPKTEAAVLGAMLSMPAAIDAVADTGLVREDFHNESHQRIYDAIQACHKRGAVDERTVINELGEGVKIVGGPVAIIGLIESCPAASNARHYASTVQSLAVRRNLLLAAHDIAALSADDDTDDTDTLVTRANELLAGIAQRGTDAFVTLDSLIPKLYDEWGERENTKITPGLSTGFRELDAVLGGLHRQRLHIIGARPGMGKTALALNLAENAALGSGAHVALFSLEMGAEELATRFVSGAARINGFTLRNAAPSASDFPKILRAMEHLNTCAPNRVLIDDTANQTPQRIRATCRRLARKLERQHHRLDLVVIDYLQLMTAGRRCESRQVEVGILSRELKQMSRELDVPVVVAAQLSRAAEMRADKRPLLSDLRESGSVEQDADVVMFIHRPEYYDKTDNPGRAEILVAKNRNGATGDIWLGYQPSYTRFVSLLGAA